MFFNLFKKKEIEKIPPSFKNKETKKTKESNEADSDLKKITQENEIKKTDENNNETNNTSSNDKKNSDKKSSFGFG